MSMAVQGVNMSKDKEEEYPFPPFVFGTQSCKGHVVVQEF